jgi:hypothetical protein
MTRLLASLLGLAANNFFTPFMNTMQLHAPGKHRRTMRPDKSGLPHGYPGAKLARKAAQGRLTVKHITHA